MLPEQLVHHSSILQTKKTEQTQLMKLTKQTDILTKHAIK